MGVYIEEREKWWQCNLQAASLAASFIERETEYSKSPISLGFAQWVIGHAMSVSWQAYAEESLKYCTETEMCS